MNSTTRFELDTFLNQVLTPWDFKDYGPNGMQIEGSEEVKKVAFAVSATKDSITKAIEWNADALVVHHGLFWNFHGVRTLTGPFGARVLPLIQNNISLIGHHLPLDAHPTHGNAATLAQKLDLVDLQAFGDYKGSPTGIQGVFTQPTNANDLQKTLAEILDHEVLVSTYDESAVIKSIGIITGGANGGWAMAEKEGLDAYLTGEMSEHDWNEAKEWGVHMFAGGHHATEKFGIQAIMEEVSGRFKVECQFFDSPNPA